MEIFRKETIIKISRNKKLLESRLKVKINSRGNAVDLEGQELDIYIAEKVLEAIDKNFPVNTALLLTEEDYMLEDIPIKNLTKKKPRLIKARIIGTKGKTLKLISELSGCYLQLNDNIVSIIGQAEKIRICKRAIENLTHGLKQSSIYAYLEKARKKRYRDDLGLKE